ncbi:hypothetical protein [Streptomyces minutiscleroticus]|uniref:Uncharacterized protein n=1 Tax=Streptomyces minutiscleroticus TaxID=68238 RepID=A0A918NP15_9ACTN|nr:hypothetical protein [Streptomyces minutiscleroticus]GGX84593.1 hypothetical protein GCM10010358_43520 [Streptomyces minutiscleroticus]
MPGPAAAGLGVSAVPASFRFARRPGLESVPLRGPRNRMSVVRRDEASDTAAAFVTACRAAARDPALAHGDVWRLPGTPGPSAEPAGVVRAPHRHGRDA